MFMPQLSYCPNGLEFGAIFHVQPACLVITLKLFSLKFTFNSLSFFFNGRDLLAAPVEMSYQ